MKKLAQIALIASLSSSYVLGATIDSIGINVGKANTHHSKENKSGTITLTNSPDENFDSYEIYTTLSKEIFKMSPYVSYSYNKNDEFKHQYVLGGLNKYYDVKKASLYAGVLGGYGQIDWKYSPLSNSTGNSNANSIILGLQVGVTYPITSNFALGLDGKYLAHKYETDLVSSSSNAIIEQDHTSILSLNIKYSF